MLGNSFSVKDKVVIVTGAARGNGRAIAEGFYHQGSIVFFIDILEEVTAVVRGLGDERAFGMVCDVAAKTGRTGIVPWVLQEVGRIDVLINNAGISIRSADPYEDEVWERTCHVNMNSAFFLCKQVIPVMKKQQGGGAIINITSLAAELGFPDNPSYIASKGGLKQLTKALARDFGRFNIRVNNVCPGYIRTSMTSSSYQDPLMRKERDNRIILGRWGEPEDLVGACIFLASDAASYITGIDLPVDGGWLAKGL